MIRADQGSIFDEVHLPQQCGVQLAGIFHALILGPLRDLIEPAIAPLKLHNIAS